MDSSNEAQDEKGRASYGAWIALLVAAAGVAAAVVYLRRRGDIGAQIARAMDRCEAADGELERRMAAA